MGIRKGTALLVLASGILLVTALPVPGQATGSESVVKSEAKAEKADADGKQVVTITLTIDKKYHVYANPVGLEDLQSSQTIVTVTSKTKPESVKVEYPKGEVKEDKVVGNYKIYKGKVTIKATVQRARGDTGPLQVAVKLQACDSKTCLMPSTVKLSVP
jgi:thiol:disulfide interchange protein